MSASSQDEEGNKELLSEHDEEKEDKVDGSPTEVTEGAIQPEEEENGLVTAEEAPETDVVVKKSAEDVATEEDTEETTESSTDGDIKRTSVDIVQKSTEDVTEKTKEEKVVDKPEGFVVESPKDVGQKTDEKGNGLFPRELLLSSATVTPEIEDIPQASSEAMKFFSSITEKDLQRMVFNDSLVTTSDEGDLGEFLISIEKCTFQEEECFSISAKSVGSIEGILCGTSLVAYVDMKLQTIEQRHHEYVELNNCPLDRKTLITQKNGLYMFTKTISEGETTHQVQKAWNIKDLPILMLEGANTLFLRLLITKGTVLKDFLVPTLDSDGCLCNSKYKNLEMKNILINKEDVTAFGLQRTVYSKMDSPISWKYHFMDDGHLLSRTQLDSHVRMRVTTLPIRILSHSEKST
ncbi:ciliogenesis-associated TTC17-interacting protein [Octopus bimaculoides]|uniref:ciliogenesis-associated TTC17-interacting protein n=1 Tax=Octopus bimaculoides TaxID=37653 RepID=UPI0022E96AA5|nr:ciliogenesis-associated TTC17-interacting protein [Octopus bimaculoides]XP_052833162.1 ciliogenesis-associated TTC17-interacting protein [Octopus bimaculoides]XP_052833163.1 ciliogenesis-associated TTC17-interacting protein [Octopus bimaculoides]